MEIYGKESLREAFGKALVNAGKQYDDLYVLDAGTSNSTMSGMFAKNYPDRFFTAGINELGMIGLATGLAMAGKRAVACDMSVFLHQAYDHIRTAARQGKGLHLIIAATHTGVAVGPDGGSAHDLSDVARMRLVPGFTVITPLDGNQVHSVVSAVMAKPGFYYIRLNRPKVPVFLKDPAEFTIGKAYHLAKGERVTILAMGDKAYSALVAAEQLGSGFADVIGISTVEPLDKETILASVKRTGRVVTVEDHLYIGGLFESVAGMLAQNLPTPIRPIALDRIFTTSGETEELEAIYKIDVPAIVETCRSFAGTA